MRSYASAQGLLSGALLVVACAGGPAPREPTSARAIARPAPRCLTLRDQELACQVSCDVLGPVLEGCAHAAGLAPMDARSFSVSLRARSDGRGGVESVHAALPRPAPPALRAAGACFEDAMRRFRYCRGAPPRGAPLRIPLRVRLRGHL